MFDQILVPVDQSLLAEYILPHVITIAQAYQSKVVLINVVDSMDSGSQGSPTNPLDWRIKRSEADAYLKDVANRLNEIGVSTETILLEGKAPDHLIQHSNSMGNNLIMLSSHGQGGISSWSVSSVAMKVIQQARTSIMIVRPSPSQNEQLADRCYKRILAPVDGSKRAEYGLSTASFLAQSQGAELVVAHVIKPPELPRRIPLSAQENSLVKQVVESNRVDAMNYLNNLQGLLNYPVKTHLLVEDQVPEALYSLIEQEGIDLVVLNAHGLSGNPNTPYGSVALNFLIYNTTPLLIVQDFQRDRLIQSQAEKLADEQQGYQDRVPEETRNVHDDYGY